MTLEVFIWHRNGPVVMDDELFVCREPDVEFYAVKHREGMPQAFEGVFGRRFPQRPFVHDWSSPRSSSKVAPAVGEYCSLGEKASEGIKPHFMPPNHGPL